MQATLVSSNTIGNVPSVILLIKLLPHFTQEQCTELAMLSIFSGNLLLAESTCNIIVAEHANSVRALRLFGLRALRYCAGDHQRGCHHNLALVHGTDAVPGKFPAPVQ